MHSPIFKAAFSSDGTEEYGTDNASAGLWTNSAGEHCQNHVTSIFRNHRVNNFDGG